MLAAARRELSIVGTALVARGSIERADDIVFVDLVEAREGLAGRDLRRLIAERASPTRWSCGCKRVPRVLLSDGTEPEAEGRSSAAPDGALTGTAGSSGCVTGVARVVLDPSGARLRPGEILVASSTDPGWTPLFLVAGGLVMEMGRRQLTRRRGGAGVRDPGGGGCARRHDAHRERTADQRRRGAGTIVAA